MTYPKMPNFSNLGAAITDWACLKHDNGAKGMQKLLDQAARNLQAVARKMAALPEDAALKANEPDSLPEIKALRHKGPRVLWRTFDATTYSDRLAGAFLARMAGCILGAPVELWKVTDMAGMAKENGQPFPPTDYWKVVQDTWKERYIVSRYRDFTRGDMNGVPADDDIIYTLLGLLIAEDAGLDFTVADVGRAWVKYLPMACTAEDVALKNLKRGVPAGKAGATNNPYCQWIGADIRSDPWGYLAPGQPQRAAEMAYRDAYISHRRNGIYGEMFFAAAIAAAFAVDEPLEAIEIGLTEIPRNCRTAAAVKWSLKQAPKIKDYLQARSAVDKKFTGMHHVHTINNACLTIFGLAIGGRDVTKVLSQTVAMGLDNDCTAATAGSIVGACVGRAGVPKHWIKPFHNKINSYLTGKRIFRIDDVIRRFSRLAAEGF